jgi:sporulation protein YlmC with PRC-barrel domain
MSTSSLTGDEVRNHNDEVLGSVADIMIDCSTGKVSYVVMSSGGFLGLGEKLFALPMSALTLDTENECMRMEANKELFENLEGFDKDNWPDMADVIWEKATHQYFAARPYWQN